MKIHQQTYRGLKVVAVRAVFDSPLGNRQTPDEIFNMLDTRFEPPICKDQNTKTLVRYVLRQSGYKPTGRGKPASEYLAKAVSQKRLSTINPCVDVLNIVSLHSGFPISVVDLDLVNDSVLKNDLDLVTEALTIKPAPPKTSYIFNVSGQEIKLDGLVCLYDATGPCANGVKDSQRTKTSAKTTNTLSIFWGIDSLEAQVDASVSWYGELLRQVGATVEQVPVVIIDEA